MGNDEERLTPEEQGLRGRTHIGALAIGRIVHGHDGITVRIGVQTAAQIILVLLNLLIVVLEDAVDDHSNEEQWPFAFKTLELLQLARLIIATRFVLCLAEEAVAGKAFEAHFATQAIDDILFGLLNEAVFV